MASSTVAHGSGVAHRSEGAHQPSGAVGIVGDARAVVEAPDLDPRREWALLPADASAFGAPTDAAVTG